MKTYTGRSVIAGFVLLAVGSAAGTVALAGGGLEELGRAFGAGIAVSVIIIGTYKLSSSRGVPHSHSVAFAGVALGLVYAVTLLYRLLTEFGA
jgi:hypothetical protein